MARWAYLLGFLVAVAVGGAAAACLPGLLPTNEQPDVGPSVKMCPKPGDPSKETPCCGDGVIELDAGETCDPLQGSSPYCSKDCHVVCDKPDGGAAVKLGLNDHCYLLFPGETDQADAGGICKNVGGHIVTFAGQEELDEVVGYDTTNPSLDVDQPFWVGLQRHGQTGAPYFSVNPPEPGWAPGRACPGCYVPGGGNPEELPVADAGDAGPLACMSATSQSRPRAQASGCNARAAVVCEREPVGSITVPCPSKTKDVGKCFDLVATYTADKHYFFSGTLQQDNPVAAESYCNNNCGGNGSPSGNLVVLQTPDEREQLVAELSQLGQISAEENSKFWIGLSVQAGTDGGLEWQWDDKTFLSMSGYASVWGAGGPLGPPPLKSYRAYLALSTLYDVGLAHAAETPGQHLPFVCQWYGALGSDAGSP
jgi:hypothetical protein